MLDLAGNDYLGLARAPRGRPRPRPRPLARWGAARPARGWYRHDRAARRRWRRELAGFCGAAAALVFSSGYLANLGAVTALGRPGRRWSCPTRGNHASLIDGCRLSRSPVTVVAARATSTRSTRRSPARRRRRRARGDRRGLLRRRRRSRRWPSCTRSPARHGALLRRRRGARARRASAPGGRGAVARGRPRRRAGRRRAR